MLYHFLHTPLSSLPNRRGAIFSSVRFLRPGFSLSRFCRGRRTRRAVRKSSKRHTQRKQTRRRRAANAALSRPTDRFVQQRSRLRKFWASYVQRARYVATNVLSRVFRYFRQPPCIRTMKLSSCHFATLKRRRI